MNGKILVGDVLEKIKEIPDESIDCVITSPPYWGLRDYGTGDAQWGLEDNFNKYLDKLDLLMDECWRVLKKTGTCWINLGDTYSGGGGKAVEQSFNRDRNINTEANPNTPAKSKYRHRVGKSRFGIPERFYVRCIDNGWIARNHIPWVKSNSMPSSVTDRFTNKWESVFFFAKAKKYYFNLDAIRVPVKGTYKPFNRRVREAKRLKASGDEGAIIMAKMSDEEEGHTDKNGFRIKTKYGDLITETKYRQGMNKERGNNLIEKRNLPEQKEFVDKLRELFTVDELVQCGLTKTTVEHWFRYDDIGFAYPDVEDWRKVNTDLFPELLKVYFVTDDINPEDRMTYDSNAKTKNIKSPTGSAERTLIDLNTNVKRNMESRERSAIRGKNPGDVFEINTRPFAKAHFATFPPALPEKILKCACPVQVCNKCGKARTSISERQIPPEDVFTNTRNTEDWKSNGQSKHNNGKVVGKGQKYQDWLNEHPNIITGYTECGCNAGFEAGTVLDPFFGSGTVGLVADQLDLNWIGIELKEEYAEIARKRIGDQEKLTKHL